MASVIGSPLLTFRGLVRDLDGAERRCWNKPGLAVLQQPFSRVREREPRRPRRSDREGGSVNFRKVSLPSPLRRHTDPKRGSQAWHSSLTTTDVDEQRSPSPVVSWRDKTTREGHINRRTPKALTGTAARDLRTLRVLSLVTLSSKVVSRTRGPCSAEYSDDQ